MTGFEPFFDTEVTILDAKGLAHKGILLKVDSAKETSSGEEEIQLKEESGLCNIKCSEVLSFAAQW